MHAAAPRLNRRDARLVVTLLTNRQLFIAACVSDALNVRQSYQAPPLANRILYFGSHVLCYLALSVAIFVVVECGCFYFTFLFFFCLSYDDYNASAR